MEKTTLFEALKTKVFNNKVPKSYTDNNDDPSTIDKSVKVDYDDVNTSIGFFDDGDTVDNGISFVERSVKASALKEQADFIDEYRNISNSPEGRIAVDEIVNEAIFSPGAPDTLKMNIDNSKLTESTCNILLETFDELVNVFDVEMNISYLFEKWYVDGQLAIQIVYDNNDLKKGIVGFNVLEPKYLLFNNDKKVWSYVQEIVNPYYTKRKELKYDENREYSSEEIIFISSELFQPASADISQSGINIIKSHLHNAIKVHNQLNTLEDMLIPMRFSRSVSRRVFNVDVGDLPATKAEAALNRIKDKFKYKKFYDVERGTISNQMHIASLVEDYWFQNRDGAKGTQVDTLDESGNLGELGDITYFRKKLFTSLKIPQSRVTDEVDGQQAEFDYSASQVSREEIKFFSFIQRLRRQFLRLFRDSLKRHLLYKGVVADEDEWNNIKRHFQIHFYKENIFLETMETELLTKKLDLYSSVEELIGKEFSKGWVRRNVLKLSDSEIEDMKAEIKKEKEEGEFDDEEGTAPGW